MSDVQAHGSLLVPTELVSSTTVETDTSWHAARCTALTFAAVLAKFEPIQTRVKKCHPSCVPTISVNVIKSPRNIYRCTVAFCSLIDTPKNAHISI